MPLRVEQSRWTPSRGWETNGYVLGASAPQLVLVFGSRSVISDRRRIAEVTARYPDSLLMGCSTAGEIFGTEVGDESLVTTAVRFARTGLRGAMVGITDAGDSEGTGARLARSLDPEGLTHVFLLSDGIRVNGSELVRGLTRELPDGVTVTGGLSGDGTLFQETAVLWQGAPVSESVAAIGFYGDAIRVGFGSLGGWAPFGPERLVTRSAGNVLYELDGRSALGLYKRYLDEHAAGLPATGLYFPLALRTTAHDAPVVRTICSISEDEQSLTFAGDIPEGSYARLMRASFDRLVDGAIEAARASLRASPAPELAVLISCVGRKMILKQRVEEEVEGVRDVLGEGTVIAGFYSYGEISPFARDARCELHNQTMSITTFAEA